MVRTRATGSTLGGPPVIGRSPTLATADKILAFIRAQEQVGR